MNRTINPIYSQNLSGNLPENGAVQRPAARNGSFTDMMEELRTVSSRTAEPKFDDKSEGDFWEQRMERQKKFMELQQKAAARRRMLLKMGRNGGTVSAAELLMGLL